MAYSKKLSILLYIISALFISCGHSENNMQFSFEDIQNHYYKELGVANASSFAPFYINKDFFQLVEHDLNEAVKNSDYCSVLITSSVENGMIVALALYNYKSEICFCMWNHDEYYEKVLSKNSEAKKILKTKPRQLTIINKTSLLVMDGTSDYIIKKIDNRTYYYTSHNGADDADYKLLMDLFRTLYKEST